MKFEDSKYFKILKHHKIEKPFGYFYFFENFIISEIHEGVHFDLKKIEIVSEEVLRFYKDPNKKGPTNLVYISNRINSYSLDPNSWPKVETKFGINHTRIIVTYNNWAFTNALIEKMFSKGLIKCYQTLDDAITWTLSLNE